MRKAISGLTEAGALLLAVAQFLPLFYTHVSSQAAAVGSGSVGAAHAWGVLLIAALGAVLGASLWVSPSRFGLALVGLLGVLALVISLTRDLSDAHARGLAVLAGHYDSARNVVAIGLYVEITGALVLLFATTLGVLHGGDALKPAPRAPKPTRRRDPLQARRRQSEP